MLNKGPLRDIFENSVINKGQVSKYFSEKKIKKLLNLHVPNSKESDHSNTLWRLLALELWLSSL